MPTWPSPRSERLGTPKIPAIRFTRGSFFGASRFTNATARQVARPPLTDRTRSPRPQRAFTSRLPAVWSPSLPLDITTTWTGLLVLAGLAPAGMAASLAAPDPARAPSALVPPGCRTLYACRWHRPPAIPGCPAAESSSQQFNHLSQRLRADLAAQAHPCPTAKHNLDDAVAIRPPRPIAIGGNFDWHHRTAFHRRLRQQLPPPSEQLVAVHIVTPRHD